MPRQRDYAAEYARRVAKGASKGLSRQRARGHFEAPALPTGITRKQRHLASLRRRVETGEHAVYGEFQPFGDARREPVLYRHFAPRSARRLESEITRLPPDTFVQIVVAGQLATGYADYRGTGTDLTPQWRTVLSGTAEGPVNGPGGRMTFGDWADALDDLATDVESETGEFGFAALDLYELRIMP